MATTGDGRVQGARRADLCSADAISVSNTAVSHPDTIPYAVSKTIPDACAFSNSIAFAYTDADPGPATLTLAKADAASGASTADR